MIAIPVAVLIIFLVLVFCGIVYVGCLALNANDKGEF
jgi:hypothetical protein